MANPEEPGWSNDERTQLAATIITPIVTILGWGVTHWKFSSAAKTVPEQVLIDFRAAVQLERDAWAEEKKEWKEEKKALIPERVLVEFKELVGRQREAWAEEKKQWVEERQRLEELRSQERKQFNLERSQWRYATDSARMQLDGKLEELSKRAEGERDKMWERWGGERNYVKDLTEKRIEELKDGMEREREGWNKEREALKKAIETLDNQNVEMILTATRERAELDKLKREIKEL